jgi:hypothetical protein
VGLLAFVNVFLAVATLRLKELALSLNANLYADIIHVDPSLAVLIARVTVYGALYFVISKRSNPFFVDDSVVLRTMLHTANRLVITRQP